MVNSILNPEINYPELKKLDSEDSDYDASLYENTILGIDVIIALGQSKYNFIEHNIIYYPIYLVKNDRVSTQIGVYEIMESQLPNIVDEDGDIDLDMINPPIIYGFVNVELLKTAENKDISKTLSKLDKEAADKEKEEDEDEDEDEEEEEEEEEGEEDVFIDSPLPEQNEIQAKKEVEDYSEDKSNLWIQKYMTSNEYKLIDNEGGGDCLFAAIRDAFKSIDKDLSISDIRKKLSEQATQEIYDNYKLQYTNIIQVINDNDIEMKRLNKLNIQLRDRLKQSKKSEDQYKIVESAKLVAESFKKIKSEQKVQKELLSDFKIMKKVHSLEDFKKAIRTCEFWADTWAISTLERILNIKLIILSSESWKDGDKDNVLQCGILDDPDLESLGIFEPQYYIIMDHTGIHYKLISYKNHNIFNFKEIPYNIKLKIANKCLEGVNGSFKIIPQFQMFYKELGIQEPIEINAEIIKESENTLYNPEIVFQYYIKSNNKPLPGKGNGEKIELSKVKEFSKLYEIPEWRRKLDNEYPVTIDLDGHKWKTVEHYIQANKFKNTNKEYYILFSLDSNSNISKDVELAKAAGSKSGRMKGELLRSKDIKVDPEYYGGIDAKVLENGLHAKFTQHPDLNALLKNTKDAKLLHYKKGNEPQISNELMIVRNKIKE